MGQRDNQPLTPGEHRLVAGWRRIRTSAAWLVPILVAAGAVLIGFGPSNPWPFWIGVGCTVVALVLQIFAGPRLARLIESERTSRERSVERAAAIQKIMDAGLRTLMDSLSVDFSQSRISIYRHKGDHFIMLARVSDNLDLQRPGRGSYPDSEGIIHTAWTQKDACAVDLPEDRADWEKRCARTYGMDARVLASVSMQCLSIAGTRIDHSGRSNKPIGLLIVESLSKRGVNGRTMDALKSSEAYPLLEHILVEAIACLDERDVEDFRSI